MTQSHKIVSHDQWIEARKGLLAKEKEFTRLRDELSQQRRHLPWERVDKEYVFEGPKGTETLAQLFAGKSQLIASLHVRARLGRGMPELLVHWSSLSLRRDAMTQKLSGGCACGAIHYDCNADPVIMFNCHCRDCQRASGSAYAAIVVVPKAAVQMRGEPRYHKIVGSAGKAVERGFCPICGSHVIDKLERLPDILGLQAGSLDDPSMYRPMMDVFTSSAQPWDHMDPKVQKHTQGAPR